MMTRRQHRKAVRALPKVGRRPSRRLIRDAYAMYVASHARGPWAQ